MSLDKPVQIPTTRPLPLSWKPWIGASDSAESGPFSPLVSPVPWPSTHPILGSSESWVGEGSDPMVVSRTRAGVVEDGSGFWWLSYPQLLAQSSTALPVNSPWDAPAVRRPFSARVCLPLSLLNDVRVHSAMMSFPECQCTAIKGKRHI